MSNLVPDPYEADRQAIARKRALAQALQQQALQPQGTQQVGGIAIRNSPLSGITPIVQALMAKQGMGEADTADKALQGQIQQRRAADMSLLANALGGRPASLGGLQEDASGNVTPTDPVQALSPAQSLQQAIPLLQDPQLQQFGLQQIAAQQPKKPEAFTLPPGSTRYDESGRPVVTAPQAPEKPAPFTLPPGGKRFDSQGNEVASVPPNPPTPPAPRQAQVIQTADGPMIIGEDGTAKPIAGPGGVPIKPPARQGGPMTATAQKELIETEEQMQGGQAALDLFKQARLLNDKAMGFSGAGALANAGSFLPEAIRPGTVDATQNLDNILQTAALPQLKAIFGGMPTEGERKILLDVQGSSSKPASVRKDIFDRAEKAIQNRIKFASEKAKRLRDGTYFTGEGLPSINPEGSGGGPAVGSVQGGYRFKGGNPADRNNWEKVQ